MIKNIKTIMHLTIFFTNGSLASILVFLLLLSPLLYGSVCIILCFVLTHMLIVIAISVHKFLFGMILLCCGRIPGCNGLVRRMLRIEFSCMKVVNH